MPKFNEVLEYHSERDENINRTLIAVGVIMNLSNLAKGGLIPLSEARKKGIDKLRYNALIYDDTSKEYSSYTACPIIFDFTENEGEFEVQSYYDRSTTGINANIMARLNRIEEEGCEKVVGFVVIDLAFDFPSKWNSIFIVEKTGEINIG